MDINNIPNEILEYILSFVDIKKLILNISEVSKLWNLLSNKLTKYRIESENTPIDIIKLSDNLELSLNTYYFIGYNIDLKALKCLYKNNFVNDKINNYPIDKDIIVIETSFDLYLKYYIGILYDKNNSIVNKLFYKSNSLYYTNLTNKKLMYKLINNKFYFDRKKFIELMSSNVIDFHSIDSNNKWILNYMYYVQFKKKYKANYFIKNSIGYKRLDEIILMLIKSPNYYIQKKIYDFGKYINIDKSKSIISSNKKGGKNKKIIKSCFDDIYIYK